jgi:peptidyl-prolyl cis-trans isomerase SurA
LAKDGVFSKPFQTSHGWHIIKRIAVKPTVTDPGNKDFKQELQQKIMADSRWRASKDFVYKQVTEKAGVKKFMYDDAALWALSDSLLDRRPMREIGRTISSATPLFSISKVVYDAAAWINYAGTYRFRQDGTGAKPHEQVREE